MRNKKLLRSMVCGMLCTVMVLTEVGVTERTSAASRYVCNQCGKSLSSAHESHTRECGGVARPYKWICGSCGQILSSSGAHTKVEDYRATCPTCGGRGSVSEQCSTCNGSGEVVTGSHSCTGSLIATSWESHPGAIAANGTVYNGYVHGFCNSCGRTVTYCSNGTAVGTVFGTCGISIQDKGTCSTCGGSGSVSVKCSRCDGNYWVWSTRTVDCSGSTRVYQLRCNDCYDVSTAPIGASDSYTEICRHQVSCYGTGVLQDCTLSFNAGVNGGSTAAASQTCDVGSSVPLAGKTASKTGWEFVGWNTDRIAKAGLNSITVDSDKTVYAIFKKDLTVNFIDG